MASTISVLGEPERVNLVVRAHNPDYLLLDIFLHLWLVSSSFKFLSTQRQGGSPIGGSQ